MYYDYIFNGVSQEELGKIALQDEDMETRKQAVIRITDQEILKKVLLNEKENWSVRERAAEKLAELHKQS